MSCFLNSTNEHIVWFYYDLFTEFRSDNGFNEVAVAFFRAHIMES